ncbi:MAG: alpha/beta hydrolase, partial [Candidatus Brocadiae bacterium]|nr:alpha/beta hydrolase [Candidatus Brocadiia bacterium]
MTLRAALICGVMLSAAGCGTPARLFLHPVGTVAGTPAEFGAAFEDVRMPRPGGGATRAWWVPREGDAAAVVLFGGNSGNRSHHLAYARMAWDAGFSVLMVDYQGFGPDNGEPDPGAFGQDAMAAIDFARGRATRIGVWGISLGSSVALLAAGLRPGDVSAICVEGSFRLGPAMRHYMAHVMPAVIAAPLAALTRALFIPGDADPERNLARLHGRVPVLFVHGDRDRLTRTVWGAQLFERTRGPRELWLMEDTGHAPEPLRSCEGEYAARIAAFFRETLLGVPAQKAGAVWSAARVEDGWEVRAEVVTGGPYPAAVEVVAVGETEVSRVRLAVRRRVTRVTLTLGERPQA